MRLTTLVASLTVAGYSGFAFPTVRIPTLSQAAKLVWARQFENGTSGNGSFPITGVQSNQTYPRLELQEMLLNQPNQWSLLIQAMQAFQAQSQTDQLSYYQIAGIHGVPRQDWDGVGQCGSCADTDGYCTHDMILFPAWHRVYLALFEQQFMSVVNQIAEAYPDETRPAMVGAASTMRFPYWDWAAHPPPGSHTLPSAISEEKITINGTNGTETVDNPLYSHVFADTSKLYYFPFTSWSRTLRYPQSDAASTYSVENNCTVAFDNIRASLQDQIYQLFSTCNDFLHFSNDDSGSSTTSCSNSLEGIHNTVHTTAGGPGSRSVSAGHMTYLATAAFDPIFWLHHCNVDRYFALWQALYPDAYDATQSAPHNTWTIASSDNLNMDSPLTPFHKDTAGTFWTSNDVRNWSSTFHYTYPEFANSDGSSTAIASYVNNLYGPSATATAGSSKRTAAPGPVRHQPGNPLAANNGSLFQYVANIKSPRYALNGSYHIYLFNGNPSTEAPPTWLYDPNLIGPMGVLAQPDMTGHDTVATGSIPLTRTLTSVVESGLLADMTEAVVIPFLISNLQWRVAGLNGTEIDPASIPGFEIAVFVASATPAQEYALPVWSAFTQLVEVTGGKAGGANDTTNVP